MQEILFQNDEAVIRSTKEVLLRSIMENPKVAIYDQYVNYHYKEGFTAFNYYYSRIEKLILATSGEWAFFYELTHFGPYLLGVKLSKWDEEHFGFKMANLQVFAVPHQGAQETTFQSLIVRAIVFLKKEGVKFVSSRVNGDSLCALHALENLGFRYYDNVIWPIAETQNIEGNSKIRLIESNEVDEIKSLAENFQFSRGHYYCDDKFDKSKVDAMYPKWIDTTIKNSEPVSVIESNGIIAGFFAFKLDDELFRFTGYKYGRLKLLALNSKFRGKGVGTELFNGTISIIKQMGADFIDSGYSTKNHISAKLHTKNNFYSVYEEVTLHLWLD